MPNLKDIKDRINSITSTQKITKAMKMVAAAKVKKSENIVKAGRPFAQEMRNMFVRLLDGVGNDYNVSGLKIKKGIDNYPVLLKKRPKDTAGILVITSNKGLAGAYNANVVRYTLKLVEKYKNEGIKSRLFIIGQRGYNALKNQVNAYGFEIEKFYQNFPSNITGSAATVVAEDMAEAFVADRIDTMEIVTTRFKNMMSYRVEEWRILPLELEKEHDNKEHHLDPLMTFDSDAGTVLQQIVPYYISNIIYHSLLEATASELASRMTAMSAATQSAQDMIKLLTVDYNKARQAAITNEISEVVSGADALKN